MFVLLWRNLIVRVVLVFCIWKTLQFLCSFFSWAVLPARVLSREGRTFTVFTNATPEFLLFWLWLPAFWSHYLSQWWAAVDEKVGSLLILGRAWNAVGETVRGAELGLLSLARPITDRVPNVFWDWISSLPALLVAVGVFIVARLLWGRRSTHVGSSIPEPTNVEFGVRLLVVVSVVTALFAWAVVALHEEPLAWMRNLVMTTPKLAVSWVLFFVWACSLFYCRLYRRFRLREDGELQKLGPVPGMFAEPLFDQNDEQVEVRTRPRIGSLLRSALLLGGMEVVACKAKHDEPEIFSARWAVGLWPALIWQDIQISLAARRDRRNRKRRVLPDSKKEKEKKAKSRRATSGSAA